MKKLAKILSLSLALVMCAVVLTACSVSVDFMKKKYEDAGYSVEVGKKEKLEKLGTKLCGHEDALEWGFVATKYNRDIVVLCFKDVESAEFAQSTIWGFYRISTKLDGKILYLGSPEDALYADH